MEIQQKANAIVLLFASTTKNVEIGWEGGLPKTFFSSPKLKYERREILGQRNKWFRSTRQSL